MIKITNWCIVEDNSNPYLAPEVRPSRLKGNVSGHPEFEEGELVVTGPIIAIDFANKVAKTARSEYQLMVPDANWITWCVENGFRTDMLSYLN